MQQSVRSLQCCNWDRINSKLVINSKVHLHISFRWKIIPTYWKLKYLHNFHVKLYDFVIDYFGLKHHEILEKQTVSNSLTLNKSKSCHSISTRHKIKPTSPELPALVTFLSLLQRYQFLVSFSMFCTQVSFILSNPFEDVNEFYKLLENGQCHLHKFRNFVPRSYFTVFIMLQYRRHQPHVSVTCSQTIERSRARVYVRLHPLSMCFLSKPHVCT